MEKKVFIKRTEEKMRDLFPQAKIEVQDYHTSHGTYTGMTVKRESTIIPVIDLDRFYKMLDYKPYEAVFDEMVKILDQRPDFDPLVIKDWDWVKSRLFVSAESLDKKRSDIGQTHGDIFLEVRVLFSLDRGMATTLVDKELASIWGQDPDEIFDIALQNSAELLPIKITNLAEACGIDDDSVPAIIVSTVNQCHGAAAMFYQRTFDKITEALGEDFIAIPSSKHEFICLPFQDEDDIDKAHMMLRQVNRDCVKEEDWLSDNVYCYLNGEFKCATMGVPTYS